MAKKKKTKKTKKKQAKRSTSRKKTSRKKTTKRKAPAAPRKAKPKTGRTRIERDSMGEMTVPAHVLYGATTQRAVLNFPISGRPVPAETISAFAHLKRACAEVNRGLEKLDARRMRLISNACNEIIDGLAGDDRGASAGDLRRL